MHREEYRQREARERYQRYLQTPHWRRTRLRVLHRAGGQCEGVITGPATPQDPDGTTTRCPSTTGLQVHHLHYDTLGSESLTILVCLCAACHAFEHLNTCALCEEAIFESREELEELLGEEVSLARYPLDVLEAELAGYFDGWPLCSDCAYRWNKDD